MRAPRFRPGGDQPHIGCEARCWGATAYQDPTSACGSLRFPAKTPWASRCCNATPRWLCFPRLTAFPRPPGIGCVSALRRQLPGRLGREVAGPVCLACRRHYPAWACCCPTLDASCGTPPPPPPPPGYSSPWQKSYEQDRRELASPLPQQEQRAAPAPAVQIQSPFATASEYSLTETHFGSQGNAVVLGAVSRREPQDSECEHLQRTCEDATRSLGRGSRPPGPVPEGVIRIYSMRFCPYSHRTRLVLKAKGIRHEVININLKNKPDWYFTKHPFGQIPVLENSQNQLIYESAITCEYLDDAYPGRKLFPYDPYERARQKMLLELFYKIPHLTKECLVALRCGRECADLKVALRQEFCNLEEILEYQNTTFFGGDHITMIDYLYWPWFERLDVYGLADCVNHTPMLRVWIATMKQDPAVSTLLLDKDIFLGFLNLYFQNNPNAFDFGLSH